MTLSRQSSRLCLSFHGGNVRIALQLMHLLVASVAYGSPSAGCSDMATPPVCKVSLASALTPFEQRLQPAFVKRYSSLAPLTPKHQVLEGDGGHKLKHGYMIALLNSTSYVFCEHHLRALQFPRAKKRLRKLVGSEWGAASASFGRDRPLIAAAAALTSMPISTACC